MALAVRVKVKIGTLWDDIEKAPYKILFNSSVSGISIWKRVQIRRIVEKKLSDERKVKTGRDRLFTIHASQLILHLVYKTLRKHQFSLSCPEELAQTAIEFTQRDTIEKLQKITDITNDLYPNSYPANIFRTLTKCESIVNRINE